MSKCLYPNLDDLSLLCLVQKPLDVDWSIVLQTTCFGLTFFRGVLHRVLPVPFALCRVPGGTHTSFSSWAYCAVVYVVIRTFESYFVSFELEDLAHLAQRCPWIGFAILSQKLCQSNLFIIDVTAVAAIVATFMVPAMPRGRLWDHSCFSMLVCILAASVPKMSGSSANCVLYFLCHVSGNMLIKPLLIRVFFLLLQPVAPGAIENKKRTILPKGNAKISVLVWLARPSTHAQFMPHGTPSLVVEGTCWQPMRLSRWLKL